MLYKLGKTNDVFDSIEPVPFRNLPKEKHLEDLMARNLTGVLFEDNQMMPLFQETPYDGGADIYALNEQGDLVIFELKRDDACEGAVHQILRYCETAAQWDFQYLQRRAKLEVYGYDAAKGLRVAHQSHFELKQPLDEFDFNKQQHLIIVGSAGSDDLIRNVDYWKSKGISVEFIPYRIYAIGDGEKKDYYFEFFSPPYDRHSSPAHVKGVIFDTNRSYDEDSIWYMCENQRVAAFGGRKDAVRSLGRGDIVFLCHRWTGVVAAGKVKGSLKEDKEKDAMFWEMDWLTSVPMKDGGPIKAMPAAEIKKLLKRNFFLARILKTPYLSADESKHLLDALNDYIGSKT